MKRILKTVLLLFVGGAGALSILVLVITMRLKPATNGVVPDQFHEDGRASLSVEDVVEKKVLATRPPNVVIILADDLGYGDIGAYGGSVIKTPNMDRAAAEGLRFSNAYSSAALCSPSRAGLLTGRYPLRSGIITAMQMAGDSFARKASYQAGILFANFASVDMLGGTNAVRGLPPSEITIPEALDVAGYTAMAIGKWHLGDFTEWPKYHPLNHGFDEFVGFNGSNDDFPVAFWRGDQQEIADIGGDQAKYTGLFTDEAVSFIERQGQEPFFLYLSHKDPHLPFFPSEDFAGSSEGGAYGDAVSELDASVGRVLDALESHGLAENTLVLITSDNGPWFEGSPGMFRGRKGQSYEGGYRVPLIAWWPGTIRPNSVSDEPTMSIDLFPTLLSLAGLQPPSDRVTDGTDLSTLLFAQSTTNREPRELYFFHDYDVEAVRNGPWKYYASTSHYTWPIPLDKPVSFFGSSAGARDYIPENASEPIATLGTWPILYNLELDPGEAYDVSSKYPEKIEELGTHLARWRETFYRNPRGWIESSSNDQ